VNDATHPEPASPLPLRGIPFGQIPDGCLCAWTDAPGGGWAIEIPWFYGAVRKPPVPCPVPEHDPGALKAAGQIVTARDPEAAR
jgi:hypothetical protein